MPVIDPGPRQFEPEEDGPCGLWPIDTDCCPGWPAEACDWEPRHLLAVEIATDLLWRLTAGRYGLCAELIRPCRRSCVSEDWFGLKDRPGSGGSWLSRPYVMGGRWFNVGCGCAADGCACGPLETLELPGSVYDVLEVRCDGEPLSQEAWRVQRMGPTTRLVRTDGLGWPTCQDMSRREHEPGTFSVLFLRGRKVPAAGVRAVSALACEIYKQCSGASGCRLPDRVKQVQREGVTYEMYDPGEELEQGLTGLREVDRWIRSVNPNQLSQPSAVFSLDLPAAPEHRRGAWGDQ